MILAVVVQDDNATLCALVSSFNVVNQHFAFHGLETKLGGGFGFLTHQNQPADDAQGVGSCRLPVADHFAAGQARRPFARWS